VGSCECCDEPSGSGTTEFVVSYAYNLKVVSRLSDKLQMCVPHILCALTKTLYECATCPVHTSFTDLLPNNNCSKGTTC
jgi:hypothetical protein